ncbi:MAG: hypothetical protein JWN70_5128 [Planctomycetaceae bacterium]|nr:hypothetical protein [Planctomycetaceae bacterium]
MGSSENQSGIGQEYKKPSITTLLVIAGGYMGWLDTIVDVINKPSGYVDAASKCVAAASSVATTAASITIEDFIEDHKGRVVVFTRPLAALPLPLPVDAIGSAHVEFGFKATAVGITSHDPVITIGPATTTTTPAPEGPSGGGAWLVGNATIGIGGSGALS